MSTDAGPARPPTIRTVAARAGVSKSLVSLVLQNSPRVSEQRRAAVLAAMAELGYRPDPAARSLAERRTRTVGVVLDDLTNPWYVDLLAGLRPVLHDHGLRPLLADGATEPDAVAALADLRVDGIVVVGTPADSSIEQVVGLGDAVPVVVAGTRESRLTVADVVANDDDAGARLATAHLLEHGHRRIAHIVGEGEVGRLRRDGHIATMRAAGVTEHCVDGDWTEATGHRLARELLDRDDRPTAILAANDLCAVGVLAAADELGLAVPGEVSVVGYDDTVFARLPRLSLTSVDSHIAEVGQAAGEALAARLAGDDPGAPTTRLITPALVVRGSTGPAR
ncbi:LacI family DNA-binding transcriptional regulator [Pseudonocardia lacus]|uniref:LacI family DNA-binding transcriptional regulator n=1 Tax=Pseudonocardia lacus TaxID=2835865 RepID=UPI001BDD7D91|nr:LacI family DNA-binding transcriptional regulator [Pseudonocardia lacus]